MTNREDSAWVFDSLVGFLQGPIWSAPLLTFIEEKSLIFEADTEDSKEYREVYQEYKNLVDLLLGCYMEDIGITPEQFEHACTVNKNTKLPIQFQQCLFEQIWAANEYDIFKRMMIQKNLELQLQALNMIEQKYGLTPASLMCDGDALPDDELVMEEILQKQIMEEREEKEPGENDALAFEEEHERLASKYHSEKVLLEQALKASTSSYPRTFSPEAKQPNMMIEESTENTEIAESSKSKTEENREFNELTPLEPTIVAPSKKRRVKNVVISEGSPVKSMDESPEDMKKREEYLKARRDKLVAMKKEARSQRLEMTKARPGSAKIAAEASIRGTQNYEASQIPEPSIIQVRRALAARLKAEVVGP
ncbi:cilia- and flagella-associated protein 36 isoform X2 [Venturia canescens]|uniref:cilia- and flagella-associated protein 36 isoform X2 n=1 Tax=Venturia canescens TaxID=32260 RepID=UPI001C9CCDFD|nr:cilia- and flagella-associated protein 36 isoform X2 [Venturia canescens]